MYAVVRHTNVAFGDGHAESVKGPGFREPAPYADMIYKMDKFKPENWDPEL